MDNKNKILPHERCLGPSKIKNIENTYRLM